jgi:cell fate (sporulation/competence/biofilm development) regulator YlbF (YheA/YmcA/DUF963 family)
MLIAAKKSPVIEKTEELCEVIVSQPMFRELQSRLEAFQNDTETQLAYEALLEKQDFLQGKQERGLELTPSEIENFESEREALMANPVAKGYLDAQHELQKLQKSISKYVTKTFELGRVPTEEDLKAGGCGCGGGGCGCSG